MSNSNPKTESSNRARLAKAGGKQSEVKAVDTSRSERDAGDQVNRFLLCTLVSESSKRIKASAERAGNLCRGEDCQGCSSRLSGGGGEKDGPLTARNWMSLALPG